MRRAIACVEVLLAFALCHLTYRALQLTAYGLWERATVQNFLPALVMMAFAVAGAWVQLRGLSEFGLTRPHWRLGLTLGVPCGLLLVLIGGGIAACGYGPNTWPGSFYRAGAATVGTWVILVLLHRSGEKFGPGTSRRTGLFALVSLLVFLVLPVAVAICVRGPLLWTLSSVAWQFLAGFGEEMFFRGYIQSRINTAFGRPHRWLGMAFGVGLFGSAVLFGLIHALNTVDYFRSQYTFAWAWGFWTVFIGLFFGCLRERTGSLLAGSMAHGLSGVISVVPNVLSAPT